MACVAGCALSVVLKVSRPSKSVEVSRPSKSVERSKLVRIVSFDTRSSKEFAMQPAMGYGLQPPGRGAGD